MEIKETRERIIVLLRSTERKGIEELIQWLIDDGFFEAPASTKFRGCYPGGLAKHSLRVYQLLRGWMVNLDLGNVRSPGQKPLTLKSGNDIIAALLHDVCKVGQYTETKPDAKYRYRGVKGHPKGHARLSILRIKRFITLEPVEELMIRFHMGIYGLEELYEKDSWQYEDAAEYPLRGDHSADERMSKEESQKARYGKSLRNAWYHNPICKLMYFCDEIATLEEKASECG